MWTDRASRCAALWLLAAPAAAQEPLTAIDWLGATEGLPRTTALPQPDAAGATQGSPVQPNEPPVADRVETPEITSAPLDAPSAEAVGLLPVSVTGLPRTLWSASETRDLLPKLNRIEADYAAISALLNTLLLAEADPPATGSEGAPLLAARIERLMRDGALDPALALLDRSGLGAETLFDLWFDLALLTQTEDAACTELEAKPSLSEALAPRIFCAARAGDWQRASLALAAGRETGTLSPRDADLLERFLDPELSEGLPPLPPPTDPTPLQFRLFEGIGEPLSTNRLGRAFAATDLDGDQGWKAQLAAAERLARAGTLAPNRFLGIYTEREPAASGGIWDRVEALQRFDTALTARDPRSIAAALRRVWPEMRDAGLLSTFATLYGPDLAGLPLDGPAKRMAQHAGLLSEEYETIAATSAPAGDAARFLFAVARGTDPGTPPPDLPHGASVQAGFDGTAETPPRIKTLAEDGKLGEAILVTMLEFERGAAGDPGALSGALAAMRDLGLEDTARRAALELVVTALEAREARR
ncbi:hypothetical protein [Litorisediminicola beolgyonensis]|uniref:Antifreeze glycopeptide polyprotein n=1 Tax=Litorisediminicola beolgyonensis TaxID=1173614 RepID=A0ABW3ZGE8_9RHOB